MPRINSLAGLTAVALSASLFLSAPPVAGSVQVGPHLAARYYADDRLYQQVTRHKRRSSRLSRRANKCNPKQLAATKKTNSTTSSSSSSSSSAPGSQPSPVSSSSNGTTTVSKSRTSIYNWTDTSTVMYGVNLGSWLMLEKWMTEGLFSKFAPNAVDDYTFEQTLGSRAGSILKANHWDSYVVEDDIASLYDAGINMLRIPFGYWAFHANVGGDPFAALAGQQDQISRVLSYAAKRKMYAILDLHSAVGRASQDQCNGRLNGPVQFYDSDMQPYHDAVIHAIYKYAIKSPYRNNIAAIGLVNEPDVCMSSRNQQRITAIGDYYQRSYDWMMKQSDPIPLIAHHGYCGISQWQSMVQNMNPNYFLMEDHPYPGTFASTANEEDALTGVCYKVQEYVKFPVPVLLTETTLRFKVGEGDSNFVNQMYQQQTSAFALSGGVAWWSFKGNGSPDGWNFLNLAKTGAIPKPSKGQSLASWTKGMTNGCKLGNVTPSWTQ